MAFAIKDTIRQCLVSYEIDRAGNTEPHVFQTAEQARVYRDMYLETGALRGKFIVVNHDA